MSSSDVLDLVDIATLINYERTSREPRFRHMKLRDVVSPGEPTNCEGLPPTLDSATAYVFDDLSDAVDANEPDLPSNMLSTNTLARVHSMTTKQLETVFYQARAHNSCFASIVILQYLCLQLPPSTPLRIRHGAPKDNRSPPFEYTTRVDTFRLVQQTFINPRQATVAMLMPRGDALVSGFALPGDPDAATAENPHTRFTHAVAGFAQIPDGADRVHALLNVDDFTSFLDMSSLQFGNVGRGPGPKGQGLFALDTREEYMERLAKIAEARWDSQTQVAPGCQPSPIL